MIAVKPLNLVKEERSYGMYFDCPPSEFFCGVQVSGRDDRWEWYTYEEGQGEINLIRRGFKSSKDAIKDLQDYYQNWVLGLITENI